MAKRGRTETVSWDNEMMRMNTKFLQRDDVRLHLVDSTDEDTVRLKSGKFGIDTTHDSSDA